MRLALFIFFLALVFGCSRTSRNASRILGSWTVTALSAYPLTITNDEHGVLNQKSKVIFDDKNLLQLFHSDTTRMPEVFNYSINGGSLVIWRDERVVTLKINQLSDSKMELEDPGYGTKELSHEVKTIILEK